MTAMIQIRNLPDALHRRLKSRALAEVLDAPLLTRDKRLAASLGHHARIELV